MADHGSRDHAQWSASATERNWNCAGALALTRDLPEQTNEPADWGTVCHEISELCLRDNRQADEFIGKAMKGKKFEFEVDDEMAKTAQIYIDYCRGRMAAYKAETGKNPIIFVEEYLSLDKLSPPFDAGGTGDFVIIFPLWKLLEVVDLKTGRGVVVNVIGNPQARTYGLGSLLKHSGQDITHVMSTIVQSRAPHKNGRIRSETYHIADLMEWTADLLARMGVSKQALDAYEKVLAGDLSKAEWSAKWLTPGDHCDKTFCKARGFCPALEQKAIDAAGIWFDDLDMPRLANDPNPDDPAKLARDLDMLDLIEGWCKSRREHAHRLAEQGVTIPDYILVPKQGREKWNEGTEEQVIGAAVLARLPETKYLNPAKLRTPKQVRKELGKQAHLVDGLSSIPDAGTNLVRADKTTRDAATPAVHKHFSAIE